MSVFYRSKIWLYVQSLQTLVYLNQSTCRPQYNSTLTHTHTAAIPGCPSLSDPSDGSVQVTGNTPGSVALYRCNSGYKLVGLALRKCSKGHWTGREPVCQGKHATSCNWICMTWLAVIQDVYTIKWSPSNPPTLALMTLWSAFCPWYRVLC